LKIFPFVFGLEKEKKIENSKNASNKTPSYVKIGVILLSKKVFRKKASL